MVALFLMPMESRARKRSAWNARKCLSHMCLTPNRLTEFRRRRLVSVPGTRLKRLNSLFKQQILNFSTVPVIVRTTDRQRIRSICLLNTSVVSKPHIFNSANAPHTLTAFGLTKRAVHAELLPACIKSQPTSQEVVSQKQRHPYGVQVRIHLALEETPG